jgi:hypothetical protein
LPSGGAHSRRRLTYTHARRDGSIVNSGYQIVNSGYQGSEGNTHVMTYQEAEERYFTARGESKPLINNTPPHRRCRSDSKTYYAARLHSTDVVEIHPEGYYVARNGGWDTPTTNDRLDKYAPGRRSGWPSGRLGAGVLLDESGNPFSRLATFKNPAPQAGGEVKSPPSSIRSPRR